MIPPAKDKIVRIPAASGVTKNAMATVVDPAPMPPTIAAMVAITNVMMTDSLNFISPSLCATMGVKPRWFHPPKAPPGKAGFCVLVSLDPGEAFSFPSLTPAGCV